MNENSAVESGRRSRSGIASAGGATLAARVVAQAAQLAIFIVAARVLSPKEFGLFALVGASSTLLFIVASAGWREFILGWGGSARAVNQAITYSILSGYFLAALAIAIAGVLVVAFHAYDIAWLSLIFSVCIFLAPVASAYGAILVRGGGVPALSVAGIISELGGLAAGVALLYADWGVLALAAAKLVTQAINLALVVYFARWPLKFVLAGGFTKEIVEISREILASRVIAFASNNASTFIVGIFLGVASVGYFRAAERVVSAFSELVFEPLRLLAWVVFRKAADLGDTPARVREELAREGGVFLPMLVLIAAPVFIGLAVVSPNVIAVLLGEAWVPAAPVASILAISALLLTPSIANEPLLTVTGKIRALPPVSLLNAGIAIAALFAFTRFGMESAAWARLGACAVVMATSMWLQALHAEAPWWGTVKRSAPIYTALIALIAAVLSARAFLPLSSFSLAGRLAVEVVVGAVGYFAVIALVRPSYIRTTLWL